MEETELLKIKNEIDAELNGDPGHDADVLDAWGDRYRGESGAEELISWIGRRLAAIVMETEGGLPDKIFEDMIADADKEYEQACLLINRQKNEEALDKLLVLTELVKAYPLPDDVVWTDFSSYLDGLVYQDYYREFIGDREIRRHPMRPAEILFTCGSLLIETGQPAEAVKPLKMLVSLDPVCAYYLFELGEAYKRTGNIQDALETASWALSCAQTPAELARCCRDMGYCLSENGEFEDAMMFYMLSLKYQSSRQAELEIAWIQRKSGITPDRFSDEKIRQRCEELEVQIGLSETVRSNIALLKKVAGSGGSNSLNAEDEV